MHYTMKRNLVIAFVGFSLVSILFFGLNNLKSATGEGSIIAYLRTSTSTRNSRSYGQMFGLNNDDSSSLGANNITNPSSHKQKLLTRYQQCVSNKSDVCIFKRVKVFCWIFTTAYFLKPRSRFVEDTWAQHCDGHAYFVLLDNQSLVNASRLEGLNVVEFTDAVEKRPHLYKKTVRALDWMAENKIFDKYDWFMKADDDTFVFLENLKLLVADLQSDKPYYIGRLLRGSGCRGFMSGGAGFAMSNAAIRMLQQRYRTECPDVPMPCDCDDLIIGQCFDKWKVPIFDSIDSEGKQRFFPLQPEAHFAEKPDEKSAWIAGDLPPAVFGKNCCSNSTVSFHYVRGASQSMFYNFAYKFSPRRLHNNDEHSSVLVASCLRYAIDESLRLEDLTVASRKASAQKQAANVVDHFNSSDWDRLKNHLFSALDPALLLKMLTFDESFCDSIKL